MRNGDILLIAQVIRDFSAYSENGKNRYDFCGCLRMGQHTAEDSESFRVSKMRVAENTYLQECDGK